MQTATSDKLFSEASTCIPGGVNSPVRAWKAVGGAPRFIQRAHGCTITDADGNDYIDYVGSWGPMILGHAHPAVLRAVNEALRAGTSFGAPTAREITLARRIVDALPAIEQVRLVSSGTEATMTAIRLARAFTGRPKIVKFDGCYHGHADALLVRAGSGGLTFGVPDSAGVPEAIASQTLVARFGDLDEIERRFHADGDAIAALILEPVVGNMGLVPPPPGFLDGVRRVTAAHGALLIFDEVMTGFRVGLRGAQGLYGVHADLITLGKVVGGGMPLGAFGGRRAIMENIAPLGPVYQAGTLSGNPLAVAAGIATLRKLQAPGFYERLGGATRSLCDGLASAARKRGVPFSAQSVGGMFGLYFRASPPSSYAEVMQCDAEAFKRFFHGMLERGVYLAPSAYEAGFVSCAHSDADIAATIAAADAAFGP